MLQDPASPFNECGTCGKRLKRIMFCGHKLLGCGHCHWYADAD